MIKFATLFVGLSLALCAGASAAAIDMAASIPEFASYGELYRLEIPKTTIVGGWNTGLNINDPAVGYSVNNTANYANGTFTRVAYYMELTGSTNNTNFPNGWIWVSFDVAGMTNQANKLGVPTTGSGEFYQQNVSNMTIYSNIPSIVTGTGIATGNIEFWPSNYSQGNTRPTANGGAVPNASSASTNPGFDFGDGGANLTSGHGSMQIHNYDLDGAGPGITGQTLISYGSWGGGSSARNADLGIGNNPQTAQAPDWTLTGSANLAGAWTTRTMQIFVQPVAVPEPSWFALLALAPAAWWLRRR